ncbi:hypothetical protein PCANC_24615 [Puccinia coronata f. sp. avenae]|uniref:Uncharacterized protein n=1 Tax=Puccinia coronata f. sp. avenae TaxID=200324 RepID=A0A2N5UTL1_9BASI|nr:hypothetical protein PCANC_24615 [Puccinia coronata f. sp. avenae]PLW41110.1 hypothetical protein PCASD_11845 [Puccinia coronata f. sp. avenae]
MLLADINPGGARHGYLPMSTTQSPRPSRDSSNRSNCTGEGNGTDSARSRRRWGSSWWTTTSSRLSRMLQRRRRSVKGNEAGQGARGSGRGRRALRRPAGGQQAVTRRVKCWSPSASISPASWPPACTEISWASRLSSLVEPTPSSLNSQAPRLINRPSGV